MAGGLICFVVEMSWNRIEACISPRVASSYAHQAKPHTLKKTKLGDGVNRVSGTGRVEAADSGKNWRN